MEGGSLKGGKFKDFDSTGDPGGNDDVFQRISCSTELGMSKGVMGMGFCGCKEGPVLQAHTFRCHDVDMILLLVDFLHTLKEFLLIKGHFRQQNDVGASSSIVGCQSPGGCQPSCISAHGFRDEDTIVGVDHGVQIAFQNAGCYVARSGAETRCMVDDLKVIVHGLGNADEVHVDIMLLCIGSKLSHCILGIISPCIEERLDFMFSEDLKELFVFFFAVFIVLQLVSAGAKGCRRGMPDGFDFFVAKLAKIKEIFIQDSFNAVDACIDGVEIADFVVLLQ